MVWKLSRIDPDRQLLAAQCSGKLFLANGNVATAGGCVASHYLAAWIIVRLGGIDTAKDALHYVAPVGEKEEYIKRRLRNIVPYIPDQVLIA